MDDEAIVGLVYVQEVDVANGNEIDQGLQGRLETQAQRMGEADGFVLFRLK